MTAESSADYRTSKSIQSSFKQLGIRDTLQAERSWTSIIDAGMPEDLLQVIWKGLQESLHKVIDADLALQGMSQFIAVSRSPLAVGSLFEREPDLLVTLLQLTGSSRSLGELLLDDPESLDLLRMTDGRPVSREHLVREVVSDVENLVDRRTISDALRRHNRREFLRIAYGDIVVRQAINVVFEQLTFLADAICEAAFKAANRLVSARFGLPRRADGALARSAVFGFGEFGGGEQSYSRTLQLMVVFNSDGKTDGDRSIKNQEYFERVSSEFSKLLGQGAAEYSYAVESPFHVPSAPHHVNSPIITVQRDQFGQYVESQGRTWHRQIFLRARTVSGDHSFGADFLRELQPWVYQRYLNRSDIAELQALKRRIEQRSLRSGADHRNVVSGRGGISDVEFVVQFLQLLNGGDAERVREANTLNAIEQLADIACLNSDERSILAEGYSFLRKIEHRIQILFGEPAQSLPLDVDELGKLARHLGYDGADRAAELQADYQQRTELIHRVLNHLLHDAFGHDSEAAPEVDLILDPNPSGQQIQETLAGYGFSNVKAAYERLVDLATERIRFLSTRRCRTFLASISPALLKLIGSTPNPDETLVNLCRVSDSLGGKGVLWELFSYSPPTLDLYVRLCACSPYLSDILTSNPGMLDDLMDSLVQNKLPSFEQLRFQLSELCERADDIEPILHSFKNAQHLTAGVRDILGKDDISDTMAFLSDVAEACLYQIAQHQFERLKIKYGQPALETGENCEFLLLGLGKLGGREPNYHSNFHVLLVYEADGVTQAVPPRTTQTQNHHFFHELAQRLIKQTNHIGPTGRLFDVDVDQQIGGNTGSLAIKLFDLARYYTNHSRDLSSWQALCRARPIFGSKKMRQKTMTVIHDLLTGERFIADLQSQVHRSRVRLEANASEWNLKRAPGGTLDIEAIVQGLQLVHASAKPDVLATGTLDGLGRLGEAVVLETSDVEYLAESYRYLRGVEARLRLMNTRARHDLPTDDNELKRLALLLSLDSGDSLRDACRERMRGIRDRFMALFPAPPNDVDDD